MDLVCVVHLAVVAHPVFRLCTRCRH